MSTVLTPATHAIPEPLERSPSFTLRDALDLHRDLADGLLADCEARPVRPYIAPDDAAARIAVNPSAAGLPARDVAEKLRTLLELTPATSTPRFFNQLFGGSDPAAVLGDMLAPLLNNSMYTWKAAGPHVLLENALVEAMARFANFEGGDGIFTPGGSLSNMTAMLLARNEAQPQCREQGISGKRARIYSSADAHYSIRKAAGIIGVGRANVVSIPTDNDGRMLANELDLAIQADLDAGFDAVMINATAGTTVQGAFDPLDAIADVAEQHGVWLHVDGAFGGSMLLSKRHRHLLAGIGRADSLTWDAHKMMGVPLTCSVLLTRRRGLLAGNLSERATYLFQGGADQFNPGLRSLQCGRRNDVLKLWTAWQFHGDDGYAARIDRVMALTQHAVARIEASPALRLVHRPQSVNVCFQAFDETGKTVSSETICDELHARGLAMVGTGDVRGKRTIRLVCVDPAMSTGDIDAFFDAVLSVMATR